MADTPIPGATASTYTLVSGDVAANIKCTVTGTNMAGSKSAASSAVGPVVPLPAVPTNSVAPVVTGSTVRGSVLSCTTGTWTGTVDAYGYQWYRSPSTAISGATSPTYTTVVGDETFSILCKVTAINTGGSSSPASSNTVGPITAPSAIDAWEIAVIAAGGTVSSGRKTVVGDLITGLQTDGIWSKLDRLWLFAAENTQSALIDIKANSAATAVGGPTFTTDRGYVGQDSTAPTKYINSNFNASIHGVTYTLDLAHLSAWIAINVVPTTGGGTGGMCIGWRTGSSTKASGFCFGTGGSHSFQVNASAGMTGIGSTGYTAHHRLVQRDVVGSVHTYGNGAQGPVLSNAASALPNLNMYITAINNNGTATNGNPSTFAMASAGGPLNTTETTNFYNRLRTYMTAVGVP